MNIYLVVTARRSQRDSRRFGESSAAEADSQKLGIMYIVDDPLTALAFVYPGATEQMFAAC